MKDAAPDHVGTKLTILLLTGTILGAVAACSSGSTAGAQGHATTATTPQAPAVGQADGTATACPASQRAVSTASQLKHALENARPGQVIVLAPGSYRGQFATSKSGTPDAPITLCGPRGAVLDGGDISRGYTLHLDHASWWRVEGFTVQSGQKGVVTDGASHILIAGLYVHGIGDEGIHLRDFSSDNTVSGNVVRDTGLLEPKFGEGIYVGTAHKNWCRYSGCQPDASDRNVITGNDVADTTAENIDIKEGTTGGKIIGNHLNGTGMVASAATAWINVKGNDWTIEDNTGTDSNKDGLQVHQVYPGWGLGNVFRANKLQVNGSGYGIYVQHKRLNTVVTCNNVVSGAGRGLSNIDCTRG
jgi:hypothetical protein